MFLEAPADGLSSTLNSANVVALEIRSPRPYPKLIIYIFFNNSTMMYFQTILLVLASVASIAMAAPTPQSVPAKDNSGGRVVLDGAQCSPVQGRLVCDDGTGNTL